MPVIIDGYNLLWAIQKSDELHAEISDIRLCSILDKYLKLKKQKGRIIFDGTGPREKHRFDGFARLEAIFAGGGKDADTIIENEIAASTAPRNLTVVSSDRRISTAALKRKANAVKSEIFWKSILNCFKRTKKVEEPPQKQRGLTESETKIWMEFFGYDQT